MIWSDFEFVIHLACIIKPRILDIIWPCLLIIMIMTWLFSRILFICALVVSFAALALRARTANDTTRAQINNTPSKSHVIPLLARPIRPKQLSMVTWYLHGLNGCADVVMSAFPVIFMVNEWPVASQLVIYLWTFSLLTSTYKWKKTLNN